MRRFRFSIASLLGVVVLAAIALAALRDPTDAWDGCLLGLDLAVLLTAILLVVHRTNPKRAYWLGFSLFGWVYLIAGLVPPVESRLPTTKALSYLESRLPSQEAVSTVLYRMLVSGDPRRSTSPQPAVPDLTSELSADWAYSWMFTGAALPGPSGAPEDFVRIGHSLLALIVAFTGGRPSGWLYDKNHAQMAGGVDPSFEREEAAMRLPRFKIRSLLGIVVFVGIAIAALRAADDLWDSGMLGLTLLILLTAVLLAVHRTDRRRAYWLGFALFGWIYLVGSLIPPVGSRLPTTKGLAVIDSWIPGREATTSAVFSYTASPVVGYTAYTASPVVGYTPQVYNPITPMQGNVWIWDVTNGKWVPGPGGTTEDFIRIGHSLLALVLAFFGGHLSRYLHRTDQAQPSSAQPVSSSPG